MNPVVLTFDPLPEEFFERKGFFKLMPIADKLEYFRTAGIKTVIKVPFSKKFSETSAPTFIQEILINKLQTKYLIVGEDFKFGRNREGNYNTLSNEKKFKTKIVSVIKDSDMKISSSMIRDLIVAGDIEKANGYLINEFAMDGFIVHGEKMGRKLGYPTANIEICKSFLFLIIIQIFMEKK